MVLTHTWESAGVLRNIKVNGRNRAAKLSGILLTWHIILVNWTFQLTDGYLCLCLLPTQVLFLWNLLHFLPHLLSLLSLSCWGIPLSFLVLLILFFFQFLFLLLPRQVPIFLVSVGYWIWLLLASIQHSIIHYPLWTLCSSCLSTTHRFAFKPAMAFCYFHTLGYSNSLLHWFKEGFGCTVFSCWSLTVHFNHMYILLHYIWQQVILGKPWKKMGLFWRTKGLYLFSFHASFPLHLDYMLTLVNEIILTTLWWNFL